MKLKRIDTIDGPAWFDSDLISCIMRSTIFPGTTSVHLNVTHGVYRLDIKGTMESVKTLIDSL